MFEKLLNVLSGRCPYMGPRVRNIDYEVLIAKRRAATPHIWELESIARRGC